MRKVKIISSRKCQADHRSVQCNLLAPDLSKLGSRTPTKNVLTDWWLLTGGRCWFTGLSSVTPLPPQSTLQFTISPRLSRSVRETRLTTSHFPGPEYGTTEAAWKAVLNEADRRCELHLRVKDNLVNDVIQSIKNWQKDNYHKQLMQIKERKELDDQFKRAQKPWVKLLEKVEKAKSSYHLACKNEKSAVNQERNATKDSSLSQDSVRSLYILSAVLVVSES